MKIKKANDYFIFFKKFVENEIFNYVETDRILNYFQKEKSSVNPSFVKLEWESFLNSASKEFKNNIQLYTHVPFCIQRCTYCENPSDKLLKKEELNSYVKDSLREISYFSDVFKNIRFSKLSLGGGTPSILKADQLNKLLSSIFNNFEFQKNSLKEIELNPLFVTAKKIKVLKDFGFNRLNFGVKSLNKKALILSNRAYGSFDLIKKSVSLAQKAGFWDISIDLISGFHEESYEEFEKNLLKICSLNPYRIEIYFLRPPNANYLTKFFSKGKKEFYQRLKKFRNRLLRDNLRKKIEKFGYILVPDHGNDCIGIVKNTPSYYWFRDRKNDFLTSSFGIGKYASSSIFGKSFSVQNSHFKESNSIYSHVSTGLKYEMIKYVFSHGGKIPISSFKEIFKKDILKVFELSFSLLEDLGKMKVIGDNIVFSIKKPEDLLIYSLFFLITKDGRLFNQFMNDYDAEKYFI